MLVPQRYGDHAMLFGIRSRNPRVARRHPRIVMPTLYTVATPIGNLEDITLRALRVLREVEAILCEDTRVTAKLLARFEIRKTLMRYDSHAREKHVDDIIQLLQDGKDIALVTDAGTPGIQDPGNYLVARVLKECPHVAVVPIPGPSAVSALAQVAGIPMDEFFFAGFLPTKKGRKTTKEYLYAMVTEKRIPVVLYESPYRIIKTLNEFNDPAIHAIVGRELTKKFETIYRGAIPDILEDIMPKGEFVVILYAKK